MIDFSDEPNHEPRETDGTGRQGDGPIVGLADVLHSLAVHLQRVLRRAHAETGVSAAQLSAVQALLDHGPRTIRELSEAEQVTAPTMTRLVQGLEEVGLVARVPDAVDRRAVRVSVTRRGRALLRAHRARAVIELGMRMQGLAPADVAALASASRIMAELLRPRRAAAGNPARAARPGGGP
jgi:DNA-binding MarR family transcriptional regulator